MANLANPTVTLVNLDGSTVGERVRGEEIVVDVTWKSIDLTAANSYVVRVEVNNIPLEVTVQGQPGNNVDVTRRFRGWYADGSSFRVEVDLDANNTVNETTNSDNDSTTTFQVTTPNDAGLPSASRFSIPLDGQQNRDWAVLTYADLDPRIGIAKDYRDGIFRIDNSDRMLIGLANFWAMDQGQPVLAAANGTVVEVIENQYDRNTTNPNVPSNFIRVSHGNGWETIYGLLGRSTTTVRVGDTVFRNEVLAHIGSSGRSDRPQLHFGVLRNGNPVEPFIAANSYFSQTWTYQGDSGMGVLDFALANYDAAVAPRRDFPERVNNIVGYPQNFNGTLYFSYDASHYEAGDQLQIRWNRPDGSLAHTNTITVGNSDVIQPWEQVSFTTNFGLNPGGWSVALFLNNRELVREPFTIGDPQPEIRLIQVSTSTYILDERTTPIDLQTGPTFRIQNIGSAPLSTSNFTATHGFTVNSNSPTIAPGATADFTVSAVTGIGRRIGEVRFQTNDSDEGTFTFMVERDFGGTAPTGTPVVTMPNGAAISYLIDTPAVPLDPGATVTDSDTTAFSGGQMRVWFAAGAQPDDLLRISTGAGITLSGSNIRYNGTTFATYQQPNEMEDLVINFRTDTTPTLAAVQALLRQISYQNIGEVDNDRARYIGVTVSDGTNVSTPVYKTIDTHLPFGVEKNRPPMISNISNLNGPKNTPLTVLFSVGDFETQSDLLRLFAGSNNPALVPVANIQFAASGPHRTMTITPVAGQFGTATLQILVSDANGGQTIETFNVTFANVNTPPTISDITNIGINKNSTTGPIPFTISDSETPAGSLTVTATSSNTTLLPQSGIQLGGSGNSRTITLTPAANQTGTSTITITVRDPEGLTVTDTFVLTVADVKLPPTITAVSDLTINEDTNTGPIAFTIGDPDTPIANLAIAVTSGNAALVPHSNITLSGSGANRTISIQPLPNQSGQTTIIIWVSDGTTTTTEAFVLKVNPVNDVPIISNIVNQSMNEDTTLGPVNFTAYDIETPAANLWLTFTSTNPTLLPAGSIIFTSSGQSRSMYITPAANQFGSATVTVQVTDPNGAVGTDTFVLTVNPVNDLPTISNIANQTMDENTTRGPIAFTVGDLETAAGGLSLSFSSNNPTLLPPGSITFGGSGTNRNLSITPAPGRSGSATVTVTVTDANGGTASDTFQLTVIDTNDAPTISNIANQTGTEDTLLGPIAFTIGDAETPAGSLTLTATSSDTDLVALAGITFGGSGANRTISLVPRPNASGTATITVTVTDGSGVAASDSFNVTFNGTNDPPTNLTLDRLRFFSAQLGAHVGRVLFDDPDTNDTYTYAVSDSRFEVVSGRLKLKDDQQISVAVEPNVNVTVTVTDSGAASIQQSFTLTPYVTQFPWTNPVNANDVDGDNVITPLDALIIINYINTTGSGPIDSPAGAMQPPAYLDVDPDNVITPLDALIVINWLNLNPSFAPLQGEGEGADTTSPPTSPISSPPPAAGALAFDLVADTGGSHEVDAPRPALAPAFADDPTGRQFLLDRYGDILNALTPSEATDEATASSEESSSNPTALDIVFSNFDLFDDN